MQHVSQPGGPKTGKLRSFRIWPQTAERRQASAPPLGGAGKRALDIVIALVALIVLFPLLAGVAAIVAFSSPGPVFYGHRRIGFNGQAFNCWKYRSMVVNGDEVLAAHLTRNAAARAEWTATLKLRDDPRVTPIGQVIRKLSIDELPQLLNVLMGEMSIVGPRPVVAAELHRYGATAAHYRRARPGLTGLWQVSGRSDTSYGRRVTYDRVYVSRWSLLRDLWIIGRTLPAVIFSRGSC